MKRIAAFAIFMVVAASSLSCGVNDYCLNCEKNNGDGGNGDGGDGDGGNGDGGNGDGGTCVPSGPEVCDGKDNDCDNKIDEDTAAEPLPEIGDLCDNQIGECAGGIKQCVTGKVTCTKNPVGELCDHKDNDCNGLTDEGDPGGGAKCGTDAGECVAGTLHCNLTTGTVECIGAIGGTMPPFGVDELCDGRDNDCDGMLDEGIGMLGSCGGGPGADPNAGECQQGTLMCLGGGTICMGDIGPAFEACDDLDNDCDGSIDEETDKLTDPANCGSCGNVCDLPNAIEGCAGGQCTIAACLPQFHDNNGQVVDGCEFGPCTILGTEVCNGVDDDCNPGTDENMLTPPPGLCLTQGACAGSTASCHGAQGFRCDYGPDVQIDGNGNVTAETLCDGIDNDCDGIVDEGQPNLNQACNDGGIGQCQGHGTFVCDTNNPSGPAICNITDPGDPSAPEACDALDNDCDGKIDEGGATGSLIGQEWVTIPNTSPAVQIMKYEASRPDATASVIGIKNNTVCSRQGVQPWTSITQPQAEAACTSVGARLCSELEWQKMCDPAPNYPVAGPGAAGFAFAEAETPFANVTPAGTTDTWTLQTPSIQDFSGIGGMQGLNDNGTSFANNNLAAAPRLDFQFNLTNGVKYIVWARILGPNTNSNRIHIGIGTAAPQAAALGPDLEPPATNVWTWVRAPGTFTAGANGNHLVSIYMAEDGVRVDAVALARETTTTVPPFDERTWAYQTNPKTEQPQVCNGDPFDTTPGGTDQDGIIPTGTLPQCFADGPAADNAFDMSGNVKEWTRERAPNQNPMRGGASNNEVDGLTCGLNFTLADDTFFFPNVGFRCCR